MNACCGFGKDRPKVVASNITEPNGEPMNHLSTDFQQDVVGDLTQRIRTFTSRPIASELWIVQLRAPFVL